MIEFVDAATLRKFYPVIQTRFGEIAKANQPWLGPVSEGGRPVLVTSDGKRGLFLSDPQDGTLMAFLYSVSEKGLFTRRHECSLIGITVRDDVAASYIATGSTAGVVALQDYGDLMHPQVHEAVDKQLHAYINELASRAEHQVLCGACGTTNRVRLDRAGPCCGSCGSSLEFGG